jgi:RimJ/RimL family protein N-acetyltransferase
MITDTTLHITSGERGPLYLAPYGEEELAAVWPGIDSDKLIFPRDQLEELARLTPSEIVSGLRESEHQVEWGIYDSEVSPKGFLGAISLEEVLHDNNEDGPQYTKLIQSLGTFIMRPVQRGRGIGTVAKLALITYTMEGDETKVFEAFTSEHNHPAQALFKQSRFYEHQYTRLP